MPIRKLSVMYLAQTEEVPTPSAEVRGLLLLRPDDIFKIVHQTITLGQYFQEGGKAILHEGFDSCKVLEPFDQLRIMPTKTGKPTIIPSSPLTVLACDHNSRIDI